jgi:hypothetical protein
LGVVEVAVRTETEVQRVEAGGSLVNEIDNQNQKGIERQREQECEIERVSGMENEEEKGRVEVSQTCRDETLPVDIIHLIVPHCHKLKQVAPCLTLEKMPAVEDQTGGKTEEVKAAGRDPDIGNERIEEPPMNDMPVHWLERTCQVPTPT